MTAKERAFLANHKKQKKLPVSTLFHPDSNAFFHVLGARNYKYLLTYNQVVYLDFSIARCFIYNGYDERGSQTLDFVQNTVIYPTRQ
jgi:hypothetical protein